MIERNTNDKILADNEIRKGIVILGIGFMSGIIIALFVVENNFLSKASNDGWLSFLGGLFGSSISALSAFYILKLNRKDMKENQKNSDEITKEIQDTNARKFEYQYRKQLIDSTVNYIAEYLTLTRDYVNNVADNTYGYYAPKRDRCREIYIILQMNLLSIDDANEFMIHFTNVHNKYYENRNFSSSSDIRRFRDVVGDEMNTVMNIYLKFVKKYLKMKIFME